MRIARRRRDARRGSIYVVVLGVALVVSAIGFSALTVARIGTVTGKRANEWDEAGMLASSAIEQALVTLNNTPSWRTVFANNVEQSGPSLSGGTSAWKLVDEADGNLGDDPREPARVYGIGRLRNCVRVYSAALPTETGLSLLKTASHAVGNVVAASTPRASGGPLSSAATFTVLGTASLVGDVQATVVLNSGVVDGAITILAAPPQMPSSGVFDTYKAMATEIVYGTIPSSKIEKGLLSAASNPYGLPNASGVYHVQVPAAGDLAVNKMRMVSTLLVTLGAGARLRMYGENLWDPAQADFPILLVRSSGLATVELWSSNNVLSESSNANYNPAGTPYLGGFDNDLTDQYPNEMHGLVHVIGALTDTNIKDAHIVGTVLAEGTMSHSGVAMITVDQNLITRKPFGYTVPARLTPVAGTWRWEAAP